MHSKKPDTTSKQQIGPISVTNQHPANVSLVESSGFKPDVASSVHRSLQQRSEKKTHDTGVYKRYFSTEAELSKRWYQIYAPKFKSSEDSMVFQQIAVQATASTVPSIFMFAYLHK
ncbi:hypothetical protein DPMN_085650 [Dreissena polymorpha]|uniref:Uncharacterized protein n=1 Tax=Dreissena polymorpha TaxID=45954 RepID=A0A9D3YFF7_DREPO|nr:hypothetical protein DPMN_085650 [Dreissena polymorpha]